jgi:hypothetical protein
MSANAHRGKYQPLVEWLQALPLEQAEAQVSLAEIEALIGQPLPATASTRGFWTGGGRPGELWARAGFHARLGYRTKVVTFTRVAPS